MSRLHITFICIAVLIAFVITFYLLTRQPDKGSTRSLVKPGIWPLNVGYEGDIVKDIQTKLNRIFWGANLEVDGKLGTQTANYIKQAASFPLTEKGYQDISIMAA
jgi:hypothetical protein